MISAEMEKKIVKKLKDRLNQQAPKLKEAKKEDKKKQVTELRDELYSSMMEDLEPLIKDTYKDNEFMQKKSMEMLENTVKRMIKKHIEKKYK